MLETSKSPEKSTRFRLEPTQDLQISSRQKVVRLAPLKHRMRSTMLDDDEKEPIQPEMSKPNTVNETTEKINRLLKKINESFESRYDGDDLEMQNILLEVDSVIRHSENTQTQVVVKKVRILRKSPVKEQLTYKKKSKSLKNPRSINWIFTLQNQHCKDKDLQTSPTISQPDLPLHKYTQESIKRLSNNPRHISKLTIPTHDSKSPLRAAQDSRLTPTYIDSPQLVSTSAIGWNTDDLLYFNSDKFARSLPKPSVSKKSSSLEKTVLRRIDRIIKMMHTTSSIYGASGQCLCSSELLGDGECQAECYTEDCNWDSNDCLDQQCELGCLNSMVGDTVCQETCFNAACSYDGSDCTKCTDTCAEFQLGDGVCQTDCFNKDCNWDSEDCGTQCATGCELSYLGNGICEQACNNAVCLYDESDCIDLCSSSGCDSTNLGDGICDTECNNSLCKYDSGDCTPLRYFSTVYTLTSTTEEEEEYEPENFGKVGGLGLGVVLTIAAILVGVLLCIVGAATPYWIMFFIMGILIPVIVFLVVALAPTKRDVKDEDDDRTDDSIVPRYIILAMLVVSTLLGGLRIMEYYLAINVKARRVDSRINSGPAESELLLVNAGSPQHTSPNNQNLELEEEIPRGFPKLRELEMEEFSPFTSDSISGRPRKYPV